MRLWCLFRKVWVGGAEVSFLVLVVYGSVGIREKFYSRLFVFKEFELFSSFFIIIVN